MHARRAAEDTDWDEIELLYGTLERMQPSPVVTLNRAVAVSKSARSRGGAGHDRAAGRRSLTATSIFTAHAAAFLKQLGRAEEARVAFDRAIALANTPAEAAHIRRQIDRLSAGSEPQSGTMSGARP